MVREPYFTIVGPIRHAETIAIGKSIRELGRLTKRYGPGRWRKRKGVARVSYGQSEIRLAEVHWYEATGIGRFEFKIKQFLD